METEKLSPEQELQVKAEEQERYFEMLRYHLKARKRRQRVSAKEYDNFAKDIDQSTDVTALSCLLDEMGGLVTEGERVEADTNELQNENFCAEQTRRTLMGY